jgi:hypothetical protein
MTIHIKNSNLNGSPIIKGNNNNVEVNIQSSIEKINWNSLQDELIEVSAKLAKDSKEYMASKEALNSAMNKDERGLVNIVKRNISSFTSDIFTGVASRMLVEFLMSLI